MKLSSTLIVRLEPELAQRLADVRTRTDVPTSAFVRKAIIDRLNRTAVDAEASVQEVNAPRLVAETKVEHVENLL